jgi:DNA-binding CsgD family transcriptional regulator
LLIAIATLNLGRVAAGMGDLPRAQELLEESLAAHQISSGAFGVAVAQTFLGQVMLARGDHDGAAMHFRDAFRTYLDVGDLANVARVLEGIAGAMVDVRPAPSTRLLGVAAAMRERVGHPRDREDVAVHERALETSRTLLSESAFAAAWDAGTRMSWDELPAEVDALVHTGEGSDDAPPVSTWPHRLSRRELEVLQLLAEGRSNRAIAEALSISDRTVEHHVLHILNKLGVESRTAAVAYAVRHGIA